MTYKDKTLVCRDCLQTFVFTSGEQAFFAGRSLTNEPRRCPNCRVMARLKRDGKDLSQCTEVLCDECGAVTRVPFKPTGAKPVYCTDCLRSKKTPETSEN